MPVRQAQNAGKNLKREALKKNRVFPTETTKRRFSTTKKVGKKKEVDDKAKPVRLGQKCR